MIEFRKYKELYKNEENSEYGWIQYEMDAFERYHGSNMRNFRIKNINPTAVQRYMEITELTSSMFE